MIYDFFIVDWYLCHMICSFSASIKTTIDKIAFGLQ